MTASELRIAGRAAFEPGADPIDRCPYAPNDPRRGSWLNGWFAEQRTMEAMLASDRRQS